ncbi:formate dehydrogenase [Rhodococcus sp. 14-2686-1-2]|nr:MULTISPECIES: molybdopterin-dependent oxidoreductase [unclassified Rhodococcus (in: high G+C Gram-positive bacteria)]OZE93159.1 formate dehydrogenase [Rhodococcus sp. 15-1189-1-1a]OZF08277.1 formate dehydrogenase [Rhodococcus sp. 14-2686-1-2]
MATDSASTRVGLRICPLCEACCGLTVELDRRTIVGVAPNADDVFSEGHSCAKGLGLGRIENDPDRIRRPLIRDGARGRFREADWGEAFELIAQRLPEFVSGDPGSCAVYSGNPAAHHLDPTLYLHALIGALGTNKLYSPASLDTLPKNLAHMLLYGTGLGMSVPDVDRTSYFLILGSNPMVSNGSTVTAPGLHRRLRSLQARGGTLVVVDPARTRTAEVADVHVPILPGTDAFFLLGILHVVFAEGWGDVGRVASLVDGLETIEQIVRDFPPAVVAPLCGVDAGIIESTARDFATADSAVAHSRIGTCMQEFGTITNWLVEVLTIVTGNLDRPGGAMFPLPAGGGPNTWPASRAPKITFDRWRSRVRELPEAMGELPAACFAEEILVPGPGRTRAVITIAGNPARSLPNSAAVEAALTSLEFMVSIDCYVNETTRFADVILPPPPLLTRGHFDLTLAHFQIRNVARYTPALLEVVDGQMPEWHILLRIAAIAAGNPDRSILEMDEEIAAVAARRAAKLAGTDIDTAVHAVGARTGPERLLDYRLRSGPYGDRFGAASEGLSLDLLESTPLGIDYGPMMPRIPEVLRTPNGRIDLAPPMIVDDLPRLAAAALRPRYGFLMINRRQRRGMNSWLHNALPQVDEAQCALFMNSVDADTAGLVEGDRVAVTSDVSTVHVELHVTDSMRTGVVSLPHGWGHHGDGIRTSESSANPGANYNALVGDLELEPLTGSPIFNGVHVRVERIERKVVA